MSKIILVQKIRLHSIKSNFWSKIVLIKNILGQQNNESKEIPGPKNLVLKKFRTEKMIIQKNLKSEKSWVQENQNKKRRVQKNLSPTKCLCP